MTDSRDSANDNLSNERTFLAWIRTSVGIMAFGFVVVKFSLFVKQLILLNSKPDSIPEKADYSGAMGVFLVAVGAVTTLLGFVRYHQTKKQIERNSYRNAPVVIAILTALIFLISALLIYYLLIGNF